MEWQPIKTAPKDGTKVLGFWNSKHIEGNQYGVIRFEDGAWKEYEYEDDFIIEPTHWQKLPEPP